jgi:putative transposase
VESFNRTFSGGVPGQHWFATLAEAKESIEAWRREYNESRPHRALGERTPNELAKGIAASRDSLGSGAPENSP